MSRTSAEITSEELIMLSELWLIDNEKYLYKDADGNYVWADAGDVVWPGISIDNELVLFNWTSGTSIKRASQTWIPKLTSGVIGTASPGTDYVSPWWIELLTNKTLNSTNSLEFCLIEVLDTSFIVESNSWTDRRFKFDASWISNSTTRTLTIPDRNITLDNVTTSTTSNITWILYWTWTVVNAVTIWTWLDFTGWTLSATAAWFSWGTTANWGTWTWLALVMDNSYAASGIWQSITISNTQTQSLIGLQVDTGTDAAPAQTGINVKALNGHGIKVNLTSSNLVAETNSIYIGEGFNLNSSFKHIGIRIGNGDNAGSGINTGIGILNQYTAITTSELFQSGAGLTVYQAGVAGTAIHVSTASNINTSTNWLVNYTLSDTQSWTTVIQKIDTGTSAQAHTWILINAFNVAWSLNALKIDLWAPWTGNAITLVNSSLAGAGRFLEIAHTSSGTLTWSSTDKSVFNFTRTHTAATTITDNLNTVLIKRTTTINNGGGVFNAQGSLLRLENVATQTAWTLTDTVSVLSLVQSNNSTWGHILFNNYTPTTRPTTEWTMWYDWTQKSIATYVNWILGFTERCIFSQYASVTHSWVVTDQSLISATAIWSKTLPANWWKQGKTLRFRLNWSYTTDIVPWNWIFQIKFWSTVFRTTWSFVLDMSVTNWYWEIEWAITCYTKQFIMYLY